MRRPACLCNGENEADLMSTLTRMGDGPHSLCSKALEERCACDAATHRSISQPGKLKSQRELILASNEGRQRQPVCCVSCNASISTSSSRRQMSAAR